MWVRPKRDTKPFRISIFAFRPKLAAMFQCFDNGVKGFTVSAAWHGQKQPKSRPGNGV
jgi:hypothetical protein